ncbi:thioesterase family protein [Erythrobacter ramosus]|uniref:thioesterase family protein n=1 Tax=Erythrobacter ramosus TaxID=35811 RepID=UPI001FCF8A0E|nr:thioesterase family protein [Erythrobacter ramosus]
MSQASEHLWPPRYFEREGDSLNPTALARSPWDRRAIAGGPVSSLLASCAENTVLDRDFEIARFQVDIFGMVPHQPLVPVTEVLRDGRQTKLHRVTLTADGRPVAQAHILRVRRIDTPVFAVPHDYPALETIPVQDGSPNVRMAGAITLRRIEGGPGIPGRGVSWLAMEGEIIGGTRPSNFAKACLFADFGNGFGNATDAREWSFANLDITIQFLRMPVGDWFLLDAETHMAGNGHGTARNVFADINGVYARGFQTIFVAPGHLSDSRPGMTSTKN